LDHPQNMEKMAFPDRLSPCRPFGTEKGSCYLGKRDVRGLRRKVAYPLFRERRLPGGGRPA
jgi:hypothetical protein